MIPIFTNSSFYFFFFFNDTATTEIYTLSLHDALPIPVNPLNAVVAQPARWETNQSYSGRSTPATAPLLASRPSIHITSTSRVTPTIRTSADAASAPGGPAAPSRSRSHPAPGQGVLTPFLSSEVVRNVRNHSPPGGSPDSLTPPGNRRASPGPRPTLASRPDTPRTGPQMHERRIEIRWSDLDAYAHVYHPVYLTYMGAARDQWLGRVLELRGRIWD